MEKSEDRVVPAQPEESRNLTLPATKSHRSQHTLQEAEFKPNSIADLKQQLCHRCKQSDSSIKIKQNTSGDYPKAQQERDTISRQFQLKTTMQFNKPVDFIDTPDTNLHRHRKVSNITITREGALANLARTTPRKQTPTNIQFRQANSQHQS